MNNFDQQILKNNMRRNSNRQAQVDFIRQKCVEANPEGGIMNKTYPGLQKRPIRLADVLLAIPLPPPIVKLVPGYFVGDRMNEYEIRVLDLVARWDCRQDDLTEQDEETLAFLADLLK